jgi:hypothetical protein
MTHATQEGYFMTASSRMLALLLELSQRLKIRKRPQGAMPRARMLPAAHGGAAGAALVGLLGVSCVPSQTTDQSIGADPENARVVDEEPGAALAPLLVVNHATTPVLVGERRLAPGEILRDEMHADRTTTVRGGTGAVLGRLVGGDAVVVLDDRVRWLDGRLAVAFDPRSVPAGVGLVEMDGPTSDDAVEIVPVAPGEVYDIGGPQLDNYWFALQQGFSLTIYETPAAQLAWVSFGRPDRNVLLVAEQGAYACAPAGEVEDTCTPISDESAMMFFQSSLVDGEANETTLSVEAYRAYCELAAVCGSSDGACSDDALAAIEQLGGYAGVDCASTLGELLLCSSALTPTCVDDGFTFDEAQLEASCGEQSDAYDNCLDVLEPAPEPSSGDIYENISADAFVGYCNVITACASAPDYASEASTTCAPAVVEAVQSAGSVSIDLAYCVAEYEAYLVCARSVEWTCDAELGPVPLDDAAFAEICGEVAANLDDCLVAVGLAVVEEASVPEEVPQGGDETLISAEVVVAYCGVVTACADVDGQAEYVDPSCAPATLEAIVASGGASSSLTTCVAEWEAAVLCAASVEWTCSVDEGLAPVDLEAFEATCGAENTALEACDAW